MSETAQLEIIHADKSEKNGEIVGVCGITVGVESLSQTAFVWVERFENYPCSENERKCEQCLQILRGAGPNKRELTPAEQAYIALDKRKAEVKKFFDELAAATEALVAEHGVGHFFQDADGVVYKTVVPEGRFVHFEKYSVCRTRRLADGEKSGSLSLTEARAAGFEVEGK